MAVVAAPPPDQHAGKGESLWGFPHEDSRDLLCHVQIVFLSAATANALTTVLAGFAF
eukprot:CAMPEP_0172654612 /NCGR_PEP_ID=MMETSP1074-20121228/21_1 /TAXON_ID=2916 /ORGANISM="Ceratium fusus, Strain PA161109" /LENGTH=56 /DNA_ID=CAMNT_0013469067 /DNA_START=50 /DNA_END=217 /DNA_ORIENTATION=+